MQQTRCMSFVFVLIGFFCGFIQAQAQGQQPQAPPIAIDVLPPINPIAGGPFIYPPGLDSCEWVKNYTDVSQIPSHKYRNLETCVYYSVRSEADRKYGMNSLMQLPPPANDGKVVVNVHDMIMREFGVIESYRHVSMEGFIKLSWLDSRLKWDSNKWKLDKVRIYNPGDIWVPETLEGFGPMMFFDSSFAHMTYFDVTVNKDGNVTAKGQFSATDIRECTISYEDFPNDNIDCCITLTNQERTQSSVAWKVLNEKGKARNDWIPKDWRVLNLETSVRKDEDSGDREILRVCVSAERRSSTLRVELTMPMAFSAILVLIAPFFRSMKAQLYVKLFAMLLQFMCFELLVGRTPQLGMGDQTPAIYRFYELTMACTIVSLVLTLFCFCMMENDYQFPPAHRYVLCAAALNRFLCCMPKGGEESQKAANNHVENGSIPNSGSTGIVSSASKKDWRQIWYAINNMISLILVICYLIGIIVIFA